MRETFSRSSKPSAAKAFSTLLRCCHVACLKPFLTGETGGTGCWSYA